MGRNDVFIKPFRFLLTFSFNERVIKLDFFKINHLNYKNYIFSIKKISVNKIFSNWSLVNIFISMISLWYSGSWYVIDVLWGQPIKLIQVVSTSEFHEYWWNDFGFIFLSPWLVAGPRKPQKLTTSKIKYEHFGPKFLIPH